MFDSEPRISVYDKKKYTGGLCIVSAEQLPPEDEIALRMAMLLHQEEELLKIAKFWEGSQPPRGRAILDDPTTEVVKPNFNNAVNLITGAVDVAAA